MPDLEGAGAEEAGAGAQVIAPHAAEAVVVEAAEAVPVGLEVAGPSHEGGVVIGAEVGPVFHDEQAVDGLADVVDGRG